MNRARYSAVLYLGNLLTDRTSINYKSFSKNRVLRIQPTGKVSMRFLPQFRRMKIV